MNLLQRLEHWGDAHHPKWLDIIRIALGAFLCFKGIEFMNNSNMLNNLMSRNMSFGSFTLMLIGHYIVFAHLIGGFLLAIGMLTRIAALVQIPILLGAIIFINTSTSTFTPFSELALSVLVLILLVYFIIAGNGPWSFDWFVERDNKDRRA
jgi:uncharacterized membrane protein YphA (DoxX/SURF4 family)